MLYLYMKANYIKQDENVIPWGIPNLDIKWCYKHTHYSHSVCICTVYTRVYVCMLCMYVYTYVCMYVLGMSN